MAKKRPNYITELVNRTNDYLRFRKVTDQTDTLFCFVCDYLLAKKQYDGFGFFKEEYNNELKRYVSVCGNWKDNDYQYLQIF